jgi:hypothetical protein
VFASIVETHHTDQNGQPGDFETGYSEVLRTPAGWSQVPLGPGGPKSELQLTQVRGAILAAGSSCGGMCTQKSGSAVLLRPGSEQSVVRLRPPPGVPYPWNFAAGARAIVVTYTAGQATSPWRSDPIGQLLHLRPGHRHLAARPTAVRMGTACLRPGQSAST